jgi:hypothetical protein
MQSGKKLRCLHKKVVRHALLTHLVAWEFTWIFRSPHVITCCPLYSFSRVGWQWNWDKSQAEICWTPCKSIGNSKKCFLNQSTFIAEVMKYIRAKILFY